MFDRFDEKGFLITVEYVGRGIRTLSFLPIVFPQIFAFFANFRLTLNLFHFIQIRTIVV